MKNISPPGRFLLSGVPEGHDAQVLVELLRGPDAANLHIHVARDAARLASMHDALSFFAPNLEIAVFPAWDCLPRSCFRQTESVSTDRYVDTSFVAQITEKRSIIILTTVNAIVQRVPSRAVIRSVLKSPEVGGRVDLGDLGSSLLKMVMIVGNCARTRW